MFGFFIYSRRICFKTQTPQFSRKVGMAAKLFEGFNFITIPPDRTSQFQFKRNILKRNGGTVKNVLTKNLNVDDGRNFIVVLKDGAKFDDIIIAWKQKFGEVKIPVIKMSWSSDCITSDKLLPTDSYRVEFDLSALEVDPHNPSAEDSTIFHELQKKRKVVFQNEEQPDELDAVIGNPSELLQVMVSDKVPAKIESFLNEDSALLKHDGSTNPNGKILSKLNKMCIEAEYAGLIFKANAYRKAMNSIMLCNKPITTLQDALALEYVGDNIAHSIIEIVRTGTFQKLELLENDEQQQVINKFQKVYGIGLIKARELYDQGYRSIEDLKKVTFPGHVRNGIKYYRDWNTRIPRDEATEHAEYIYSVARKVDPDLRIEIMGSYRRGQKTIGDIDFILTKPDETSNNLNLLMQQLVAQLQIEGYVECSLIETSSKSKKVSSKWYGGCRLRDHKYCRRVDFLCVPHESLGAALIYFTGDLLFNKLIRMIAKNKGMVLNGSGLFQRDPVTGKEGELIEGKDEKTIFQILGVRWRVPEERNIGTSGTNAN